LSNVSTRACNFGFPEATKSGCQTTSSSPSSDVSTPPRFAHARCHGGDIPRVHFGIERDINISLTQQSIVNAVTRPTEAPGFPVETRKTDCWRWVARVHICAFERGRNNECFGGVSHCRGPDACRLAFPAPVPAALVSRGVYEFVHFMCPDNTYTSPATPKISD
jgi:hypothetical protein